MHELSVAAEIVNIAEKASQTNKLQKVLVVNIVIGELTCIDETALRFALNPAAKGTSMENAKVHIERVKTIAECVNCKTCYKPSGFVMNCPSCKGLEANIIQGKELYVKSVEAE